VKVEGKELLFAAGLLLLLAVGLCRLVGSDRPRMRPVSVEALEVPSEPVDQGQTVTREVHWDPPDDVYLIGWHPRAGAPEAEPELLLRVGDVRIFETRGPLTSGASFPAGSGFVVRKGQRLTLRFTLANSGPAAESRGARALIYFVPVAGN
jgi:hypothetical protein